MTTRIHIVNFGPDAVEVETPTSTPPTKIWPSNYADFYVYDKQEVTVREVKPDAPKQ